MDYQEDIQEQANNKLIDVYQLVHEVSTKLHQENMIEILCDKAESLSFEERLKLGDRVIELADTYGPKYLSVQVNDEIFLFPSEIYRASLSALSDVLSRSCNCSNKHDNYKVDMDHKYSTTDTWFLPYSKYRHDYVMSHPKRIYEMAEGLSCPYELLMNDDLRIEIIDWVNTNESLGWESPPERRQNFLEDCKFIHTEDEFDPEADVYTLFDKYCSWIQAETNERNLESLLSRGLGMVNRFGTSDGYFSIYLGSNNNLIPYQSNKESIDLLMKTVSEENVRYRPDNYNKYSKYCRCGLAFAFLDDNIHKIYLRDGLECKRSLISNKPCNKICSRMIDVETLSTMLEDTCPYKIFDTESALNKLFIHE